MKGKTLKNRWNQYRRKKRWWSIIFDFILLVLIVAMLIPSTRKNLSVFVVRNTMLSPRESAKTILLSNEDWSFAFMNESGEKKTLAEYKDKPLLINFWATWCPPCVAELPSLKKIYDEYKDEIHFIFIVNEPIDIIEQFLEQRGYDIPCFTLAGNVPDMFETPTIPTTYLIGKGHLIVHKTGAARWDSGKVTNLLDRLIEENKMN